MEINDFDVAPIRGQQQPMAIVRSDLAKINDERLVSDLAISVSNEQLISSSTPLPHALQVLRKHGWFFVYDDQEITGIVTRSDLERPAISVYIFARMISVEHGLRRLLGSYSNTPITDEPPDGKDSTGPKYLSEVLKAIQDIPVLIESLGFTTKTAFNRGTGFLVDLRNHLAHGRSILAQASDVQDAVKRIQDLEDLVCRISTLLTNREQIWSAFEATNIVQKIDGNIVWAGSGATSLPLPTPVHVITAFNPFEKVLSQEENQGRLAGLKQLLELYPVQFVSVSGESADGQWSEPSFAVHGFSRFQACELARRIGQRAIFELDDEFLYVIGSDEVLRGKRLRTE
jgi:hypothetical protein